MLDLNQKLALIILDYLTSFLLMLFSVELPEKVILNFGYIILILLVYYYGYSIAIPTDTLIQKTAFMLLDIDHFKWINGNYGHANGNLILQQLATILKFGAPSREMKYSIVG